MDDDLPLMYSMIHLAIYFSLNGFVVVDLIGFLFPSITGSFYTFCSYHRQGMANNSTKSNRQAFSCYHMGCLSCLRDYPL